MMRFRVLPYKQGSKSAKALATALGGKVLKLHGSTFKPKPDDIIINWGNTSLQDHMYNHEGLFNPSDIIHLVTNKLNFFVKMYQQSQEMAELIPEFWETDTGIPDEAFPIVCRTQLAGHSGAGIVLANTRAELVQAPLYVKYEKKKDEYRVHVGRVYFAEDNNNPNYDYQIIAVQKKAVKSDTPQVNYQIRNLANGFIYKREGVFAPIPVLEAAMRAVENSGLDFGAVDVIWNDKKQRAFVLEINTAPGLEGQTVQDYANYFKEAST